jgi:hypothetical protein
MIHPSLLYIPSKTISTTRCSSLTRSRLKFGNIVEWVATNARSFSYLLPDTLELALYLGLLTYFAVQLAQQQA